MLASILFSRSRIYSSVLLIVGSLGLPTLFAVAASPPAFDAKIFVNVANKVVPSVVNISTTTTIKGHGAAPGGNGGGGPDDLFRRFFEDFFRRQGQGGAGRGMPDNGDAYGDDYEDDEAPPYGSRPSPKGKGPQAMALGTGFIIDSSGLIITNNHVVNDADEIKILFTESSDEKPTDGEVIGRDPDLDLALIKVKTKRELTPVVLGDSDAMEVGDMVVAIGNPFGQGHSVTHGIVSAKGRVAPDFPLTRYIQTDAPINPGNSGGPLVNLKGEVIGINNAIDARAQGIGFAIPISLVKKVLPQLRTRGTVTRGYIGVQVEPLSAEIAGKIGVSADLVAPVVVHVYPGEPADKAGLVPYDVILKLNDKKVNTPGDLISAVTNVNVGETATMTVLRGKKEVTLKIKVTDRPAAQQLASKTQKGKGKEKKTKTPKSPSLGMDIEVATPQLARDFGLPEKIKGLIVTGIAYGGPADRAGFMRGDLILDVDRKAPTDVEGLYAQLKEKKTYLVRVQRAAPAGAPGGDVFSVLVLDLKD